MRGSRVLGPGALLLALGCGGSGTKSQDAAQPVTDAGAGGIADAGRGGAGGVAGAGPGGSGGVAGGGGSGGAGRGGAGGIAGAGGGAGGAAGATADVPGCVAAISVGSSHACAVRTDGTLWCWGSNTDGEIGTGSPNTTSILVPTQVTPLGASVVQAAVGTGFFSCATTSDGNAWCWGVDDYGQLGNGGTAEQRAPAQVQAPGGAYAAVAPGNVSTCARTADGNAWCWGQGPLGRGQTTMSATPLQVTELGDRTRDIGVGAAHACALLSDATVWCWGSNSAGQLGLGNLNDAPSPTQVQALGTTVAALAVGLGHTCALQSDHTLWCWGTDEDGQLGDGMPGFGVHSTTPKQVTALADGVVEVAGHGRHTCARLTDGSVWCWGFNAQGELGDGTTTAGGLPVAVVGLPASAPVTQLSAGYYFTCAVTASKSAWCWGYNYAGQLGDGTTTTRLKPVRVQMPCP